MAAPASTFKMKKIIFALLCLCASAFGQAGIIESSNLVQYAYGVTIGVPGGLPNRTAIATTLPAGSSVATINSSIAGASANTLVLLSPGDYTIDAPVLLTKNNVALGGSGGDTRLNLSGSGQIRLIGSASWSAIKNNLASGYTKDSTNLVLSAPDSDINVGDLISFTQDNETGLIRGFDDAYPNAHHQLCRVTAIAGTLLEVWPPLVFPLKSALNPGYRVMTSGAPLVGAGLQNVYVKPAVGVSDPIVMAVAYGCYASNIIKTNIRSTGFSIYQTLQCEVFGADVRDSLSAGDGYPFSLDIESGTWIGNRGLCIQNSIMSHQYHGVIASGLVASYIGHNFVTNENANATGVPHPTASFNGAHSPGGGWNLWEGNKGMHHTTDKIHGNSTHEIFWNDWFHGNDGACTANPGAHMASFILSEGSYYYSIVRCRLGHTWKQNTGTYPYYEYTAGAWDAVSWANSGGTYVLGYVGYGSPYEALVASTLRRYYNYSYHHQLIRSETAVSGSPVPDVSLMYGNTKPAWWPAGKAFDQFGPGLTTVGMNPAESRYIYGDYSGMLDEGGGGGSVASAQARGTPTVRGAAVFR